MVETEVRSPRVAVWLLPATFLSAIPVFLGGFVLSIYAKAQTQSVQDVLATIAGAWVLLSLVGLWVVPLEFVERKRRLLLFIQAVTALTIGALSLSCLHGGLPFSIVALTWILMFLGASHNAVLNGLYVTELGERAQIKYEFIAPLIWSLGPIALSGGLVSAVGALENGGATNAEAWGKGLSVAAVVYAIIAIWQSRTLPNPAMDDVALEGSLLQRCMRALREIGGRPLLVKMLIVASLVCFPASLVSSALLDFALSMDGSNQQNSADIVGISSLIASLLGMLWILRSGLEKTFFNAAILVNASIVFGLIAALLGPEADRPLLIALLTLCNVPIQFAPLVSSLYIIQQVAPGRFSMSVHAFAVAFGLIVAWPLRKMGDALGEAFGFSALFSFGAALGVGAIWLAKIAPFPNTYRNSDASDRAI